MIGGAEFFTVRAKYEWAQVCIHEQTGTFMCHSSYGTYSYQWTARGGESLKEFLLDLDFDYFMKKTTGFKHMVFDTEGTAAEMHKRIEEWKNEELSYSANNKAITEKIAREAHYSLKNIAEDYSGSENAFMTAIYHKRQLCSVLGEEFWYLGRKKPDVVHQAFWKNLWPEIKKAITTPPPPGPVTVTLGAIKFTWARKRAA